MRKFLVFTFACALAGLPMAVHADDGTLNNDANGTYDFIPADQLDSSYASDLQTETLTPTIPTAPAPQQGGHGGPGGPGGGNHGGPGGGNHGGPGDGNHGGPGGGNHGGPGGGGNHGGPGGGNHGGPGGGHGNPFPIPIPFPIPVPHTNWACYSRDRAGRQYTAYSFDQNAARRQAVRTCEVQSNAGHCRLIGCRRY